MTSNNSQEALIELVFSSGRLIRERLSTDPHATPYLHLATLQYISEKERPLMREIAKYLRITPPSATSLVNALARSGQIKRINDPKDRRTVRLKLTPIGQKALDDGMRHKKKSVEKMIMCLSEKERNDLKNILAKLINLSV